MAMLVMQDHAHRKSFRNVMKSRRVRKPRFCTSIMRKERNDLLLRLPFLRMSMYYTKSLKFI